MSKPNIINNTYGELTIIEKADIKNHTQYWICKCSCGNLIEKPTEYLTSSKFKHHCGCKDKVINLLGNQIGDLTVIEKTISRRGKPAWKCRCSCGKEIVSETYDLLPNPKKNNKPNTTSCGCSRGVYGIDLTGKRFGKLVVIEPIQEGKGNKKWKCQCDCGNITTPTTSSLVRNKTIGCGCGLQDHFRKYRISKGKNPDVPIQEKLCKLRGDISGTHHKILNRDNNKCVLCLSQMSDSNKLYDHHIIPLAHDETLYRAMTNRITLCKSCHHLAHDNNWQKLNTSIQKILFQIMEWYITETTVKGSI